MRVVLLIAVRYLRARVRQSLFTIAAIALGALALTVMQALMTGIRTRFVTSILGTAPHITVTRRPLEPFEPTEPTRRALQHLHEPLLLATPRPPIPEEEEAIRNADALEERIRGLPGIVALGPLVTGQGMLGYAGRWEPVTVNGIRPDRYAAVIPDFPRKLVEGSIADLERNPNNVILGAILAERLRVRTGERVVGLTPDGVPVSFRVVGLFRSRVYDVDSAHVWVDLRRAQAWLGLGDAVNAIQIRVADAERADEAARRVETAAGMRAESWLEANRNNLRLLGLFTAIQTAVSVLTMTVAGFGIAGNLITTVSEKTFDLGVLKAMGLPARQIGAIFLVLSLLLTTSGLAVGLPAAYLAIEGIGRIPSAAQPMPGAVLVSETIPVVQNGWSYLLAGVFAFVMSVLGAVSPAMRAARLDPLSILRSAAG